MRQSKYVAPIVVFCLAVFAMGCDDGPSSQAPDPFDPNRLDVGELIVDLGGSEYQPPNDDIVVQYDETSRTFNITIIDQDVLMTIELTNSGTSAGHVLGPGQTSSVVYRIGFGTKTTYSSNIEGGGGSVVVASFSTSGGGVQATFSGTLVNEDDPNDILTMANGRFSLLIP